ESIQITSQTIFEAFSFDSSVTPVTIEVAAEDRFGETIIADSVELDWAQNEDLDVVISSSAESSPATFSFDPSDLSPGEYDMIITVEKEGFAVAQISKTLIVESPSLLESAAAAVLIFGGLILGKILSMFYGIFLRRTKVNINCQDCGQPTGAKQNACQHCGNPLPGKKVSILERLTATIAGREKSTKGEIQEMETPSLEEGPAKDLDNL
ncbi:MAG: hypothetical protein ACXAD7_08695, partial [Candidatus Kariarchaeaceae archaeon]